MTGVLFLLSSGHESISQSVGGFCLQDFYPTVARGMKTVRKGMQVNVAIPR